MKKIITFVLLPMMVSPSFLLAADIDTRDLSAQKGAIQALLDVKRNSYDSSSRDVSSAVLALGMSAAIVGTMGAMSTYDYHHYPYYRPYPYYRRRRYHTGATVAGVVGAGLLMAGIAAAVSDEPNKSSVQTTIEVKINTVLNDLVDTDKDYLSELKKMKTEISNESVSLIANIDKIAQQKLITLDMPSNQMEMRLKEDLSQLEQQGLGTKGYNKALKKLNKQAVKERKYYEKSARPIKKVILSDRVNSFNEFMKKADNRLNDLRRDYYKRYHSKLLP